MKDNFIVPLTSNSLEIDIEHYYFSDWLKKYLQEHGIDTFIFNPGASFRGLHDSLVNDGDTKVIMACHEEIAVAFAHGYYKASKRLICVLIHANVGLLHGAMAIFNAWCDRIPLLCLVGNGPLDAGKRRPWIDWIHTAHDILAPIRGYTTLSAVSTDQWGTAHDIRRAIRTVMSESHLGPAVVAIDSDHQESLVEKRVLRLGPVDIEKNISVIQPQHIQRVAKFLSLAQHPLIIVERAGRQKGLMLALENLSNALNVKIPVLECGYYENAITRDSEHHWVRLESAILNAPPDVVLALDTVDPLSYLGTLIDTECLKESVFISVNTPGVALSGWSSDAGIESPGIIYEGDIVKFLQSTAKYVEPHISPIPIYMERKKFSDSVLKHAIQTISDTFDAAAINIRIVNGGSTQIDQTIRFVFHFKHEAQFLGMNGGGGLGYGLPASLGAAAAIQEDNTGELAVAFLGDGDFLYTPSSLWTAAAKNIPVLLIVVNNGQYYNSLEHAKIVSKNRQRSTSPRVATTFDELSVDFVSLAHSFGIQAESVVAEDNSALSTAILHATSYIREKSCPFLINMQV
ncbi:thiamine pyrophosphate-binding protein [Xenorhabdus anantnagensis]|uniref:Thiamine pyrophosphate-binding protein n=1 Tax=Xenorhabdus anantnagensis TaxID=3025875 RepID=A0ABT5LWI3_9GAMM|nr:thiamine pyrophosphate-binding protein [Xenorhabdus anantnagensis]MDC9598794.1 thiamine pyrophosphate-binding protein [Xenorhabdus anantnagensis]